MLYLGVSDNHTAQLKILQALTRKFKLSPDMDLAHVANTCPFNYTGADFYALCSDAMLKAMTRVAWEVDGRIGAISFRFSPPLRFDNPSLPSSSSLCSYTEDLDRSQPNSIRNHLTRRAPLLFSPPSTTSPNSPLPPRSRSSCRNRTLRLLWPR